MTTFSSLPSVRSSAGGTASTPVSRMSLSVSGLRCIPVPSWPSRTSCAASRRPTPPAAPIRKTRREALSRQEVPGRSSAFLWRVRSGARVARCDGADEGHGRGAVVGERGTALASARDRRAPGRCRLAPNATTTGRRSGSLRWRQAGVLCCRDRWTTRASAWHPEGPRSARRRCNPERLGELRAELAGDPGDNHKAGVGLATLDLVSRRRLMCDRSGSCSTVTTARRAECGSSSTCPDPGGRPLGTSGRSSRCSSAPQVANTCDKSLKALNSSALPEGSSKNIVHCSPGVFSKRT